MARRTSQSEPEPVPHIDPDEMRRRFSELGRRLRLSFPYEGAEYKRVAARIADLRARTDDPAQRLPDLLDLAAELLPSLPDPALRAKIESWRTELA